MSLDVAVAVPFRQKGKRALGEGEIVVALSLDRDWFSPDQAKRLVDVALGRGLLESVDGELRPTFDPDDVVIPEDFSPDESILREQSTFEKALDSLVADGIQKQDAVAKANTVQQELGVTIETAAVIVARRRGVNVDELATTVVHELEEA
ncbi:DUF2240 family protein [Natronocalculus amylovorans]|uniref:DUF2240 family protein n=1 Tax=Natronocalculus amylovorans TaxID=2917812 RepID=A0AAE3K841_9EURY|nr:DUF2240 family protein [Natronocalculus amylovorans]MCL9816643.1 DUF2240 family protein [Natronocalculus amylovorans]NUE01086.1 DUF2240 family protein [Halorubraceae archaeon YAN]